MLEKTCGPKWGPPLTNAINRLAASVDDEPEQAAYFGEEVA